MSKQPTLRQYASYIKLDQMQLFMFDIAGEFESKVEQHLKMRIEHSLKNFVSMSLCDYYFASPEAYPLTFLPGL